MHLRCPRSTTAALAAAGLLVAALPPAFAQETEQDDDVRPSPPSIGTDIPVTYFGPPPSSTDPELVGPHRLLTAGTLDEDAGTITLPLYRGALLETGESVWYVVTDTTDAAAALALGLNHSGKLAFADNGRAVRTAETRQDGTLLFHAGSVDFSPERVLVPGNADDANLPPFPPLQALPGSVGDELYSPLVRILDAGGEIYNAPMVAFDVDAAQLDFCDGGVDHALVHDSVTAICPGESGEPGTVTIGLVPGFSFAKPVLYLSMEANDPLPAALEGATFAPGLRDVAVGRDDSLFSAVERLFIFTNGPTNDASDGQVNPQRQGLDSAVSGEGSALNVIGGIPTVATDYSPPWDVNLGEWTQEAVDRGYRSRMTEEFAILGMAERGFLTGPGGAPYGSSGFIVNCPIVQRLL